MKKIKRKTNSGITLVALVLTIIVLLILAGVALSLVVGEEGIIQRAITAGEQHNIAGAKEQAELLVASYAGNFYEDKYVNNSNQATTVGAYISDKLKNGETTGDYTVKTDGQKIIVKKGDEQIATGNISDEGTVTWKTSNNPTLLSQVTSADYGKATNYKVTVKGTELTDWKVFLNDGSNVYIIYGDCLEACLVPEEAGIVRTNSSKYNVTDENNYDTDVLLNALNTKNYWNDFASGVVGATATGSPTLAELNKSLGRDESSCDNIDNTLSNFSLYVPHTSYVESYWVDDGDDEWHWEEVDCYGYWLASLFNIWSEVCCWVNFKNDGKINYTGCAVGSFGIRPLICLPSTATGTVGDTVEIDL